jgi:microcin C transport system substrate-binding protein
MLPVYDTPQAERTHLREALRLWRSGLTVKGRKLVNASGQQLRFEILGNDDTDEVISMPYMENLRKLGIDVSLRIVDTSQYIAHINNFDFDMTVSGFSQSTSPGNEQRNFWLGRRRTRLAQSDGDQDPVIDQLIERVVFAKDREDLVTATHALDRVLLWGLLRRAAISQA